MRERYRDLQLPEGVDLVDAPERVIASLSHSKTDVGDTAGAAEGLIESDKEEPEVIKKGKTEDDK